MSDIYRIQAPPDFAAKTSRELARLAHQAEDTDNDLLLLEAEDEVERRVRAWGGVWRREYMHHYIDLHKREDKQL